MGEDRREALTIRQAATLLSVHPNTVRNRIKAGAYRAEKVQTENGETYLIPRSELSEDPPANSLLGPTQPQPVPTPLPDVREAMRAMLEPFVRELGDVREELGRERERRERAEERTAELEGELATLKEARETLETVEEVSEGAEPRPGTGGAQEGAQGDERRPWWRRVFR